MKKILLFMAVTGVAFLNLNCGKETVTTGPPSETVLRATVQQDELYNYNLGTFGRANTPVIIKQPSSYSISRITVTEGGSAAYQYQPAKGFTGEDEVVIQTTRETNGVDPMTVTYLRIRFTVQVPSGD